MSEFHLSISPAYSPFQDLSTALREEPFIIAQMGGLLGEPVHPIQASPTDDKTTEVVTRTWIFHQVLTPEKFAGVKRGTVNPSSPDILNVIFEIDPKPKKAKKDKKIQGPCSACKVESSQEWRKGPPAYPTLCNSCGIQYRRHHRVFHRKGRWDPTKIESIVQRIKKNQTL